MFEIKKQHLSIHGPVTTKFDPQKMIPGSPFLSKIITDMIVLPWILKTCIAA